MTQSANPRSPAFTASEGVAPSRGTVLEPAARRATHRTAAVRLGQTCVLLIVGLGGDPPKTVRAWHGAAAIDDSAIVALTLGGDGQRHFVVAVEPGAAPAAPLVVEADGQVVAEADPARVAEDPAALATVLRGDGQSGGRVKLLRHLLDTVSDRLQLRDDPRFAAVMQAVTSACWPESGAARAAYALGSGVVLLTLAEQPAVGRCRAVRILGQAGMRSSPHKPAAVGPGGQSDLLLEDGGLGLSGRDLVLVFGDEGVAPVRPPSALGTASHLAADLFRDRTQAPARIRALLAGLKPLLKSDAKLRATARELARLHASQPPVVFASERDPVGAGLDLAIPAPSGDVLVAGWQFDPHGLLRGLSLVSPTGRRRPVAPTWSVPARNLPPSYGQQPGFDATRWYGFVARVSRFSDPFPLMQYEGEATFASGAQSTIRPPAPPADARGARDAVLTAIPAAHATPALIGEVLAPVVDSLQAAHLETPRIAEQHTIGTPPRRAGVSVVIPVYRETAYLRHQLEAFACDPGMASCEVIVVLDSPEQQAEVIHLLKGLHLVYGVPVRLAVLTKNFGYAPAVNAGASLARGRELLLLNSDVVPTGVGWLAAMRERLRRHRRAGVVGPRLLFEDHSLQHAGLYFLRDRVDGLWRNAHYHKGYPADFPPAAAARRVPAVTGACMLVRRKLFNDLGGLDERYVVGDYEDSDFCLRLAKAGYHALYEPAAELFHFERQSIEDHAGYRETLAAAYNRWRHHTRWDAEIAALMRRPAFRDMLPEPEVHR